MAIRSRIMKSVLLLLGCSLTHGLTVGMRSIASSSCRRAAVICEEEMSLTAEDAAALKKMGINSLEELEALPGPGEAADGDLATDPRTECTGRVVTELVDASGAPLPERLSVKIRALQGEFSPPLGNSDTERDEGTLLAGLVGFPTDLPLKVVSAKDADVDQLVKDMTELASEGKPPKVTMRLGGRVASISFEVHCEEPISLGETRASLLADPRIKMVF